MGKLIGYARVSTRNQSTDRPVDDLLGVGVRRDDLYVAGARRDGVAPGSSTRASPQGVTADPAAVSPATVRAPSPTTRRRGRHPRR